MSEEKKQVNLRPLCMGLNLLELYADGSVALNPTCVSHWMAMLDGRVKVYMQNGEIFELSNEEAESLVKGMAQAVEMTRRQIERANSKIMVPEIMH